MQASGFPAVRTAEDFASIIRDDGALAPGVAGLCEMLAESQVQEVWQSAAVRRFAGGSRPVYALGETLALKIYSPLEPEEHEREVTVLSVLEGRLPIPTPRVRAAGSWEGWPYLLMERLRGELLVDAWPSIAPDQQDKMATELGRALRALHAVDDARLGRAHVRVDWSRFRAEQRRTAVERQRRRGLGSPWLESIDEFLDATPLRNPSTASLLHTEVMREHLLAEHRSDGWALSGLFDFEPSMVGAAEYDFASVGVFFTCANPRLLRRVLLAYGYVDSELDAQLSRRLLAYALLHRYSNLNWYLERLPPPPGVTTLNALAEHFWGVSEASRAE